VYNIIPELPREEETPFEEQVTKMRESIQGFYTNINNLEAWKIPGAPSKEREKR
jgi:hypothetical protein